jgi:hypothetical protein
MNDSKPGLDEKFKDPADPLRLVFLCAMWLTGFDTPSCWTHPSPQSPRVTPTCRRLTCPELKQLPVLNWRQKSSARSQLKHAIEDVLDTGLPRSYTPVLHQQKCTALFEHVYESYAERDVGVYASAWQR